MMPIPKLLLPLLALAPALSLAGCATADPTAPDRSRFEPVAMPVAPAGEASCDGEPCLSEQQADHLFNATIDVACAANDKLAWLLDFYFGTTSPPSCGAAE